MALPPNGVLVVSGTTGQKVDCVTDPTKTTVTDFPAATTTHATIATQCCEPDETCRRYIETNTGYPGSGQGKQREAGCVSGKSSKKRDGVVPHTYAQALWECEERDLELCPAKSCYALGCNYDFHPVWTNKECGEADLVSFKLETSRRRHLSEASTIDQLAAAIAEQIPAATDIVVAPVDGGYSVTFTLYGEVNNSVAAVSDPSFATAISDATDITFEPVAADSVAQATESALRHVVGSASMDEVITDGREAIAIEVQERLQLYLQSYGAGIDITKVNIDRSAPPIQVQDAFNDVQKAKEDQQKFINQATAYAQQVVPEARGRAQRQLEEAQGYRDQVIARSEGEAQRFEKLLVEYSQAKQVTRDRLYIDAMENVFKNSSKVMIDVEGGNNMMYLPLDKLGQTTTTVNGATDVQNLRRELEQLRREVGASRTTGTRGRTN